jgi:hypothetical protein
MTAPDAESVLKLRDAQHGTETSRNRAGTSTNQDKGGPEKRRGKGHANRRPAGQERALDEGQDVDGHQGSKRPARGSTRATIRHEGLDGVLDRAGTTTRPPTWGRVQVSATLPGRPLGERLPAGWAEPVTVLARRYSARQPAQSPSTSSVAVRRQPWRRQTSGRGR